MDLVVNKTVLEQVDKFVVLILDQELRVQTIVKTDKDLALLEMVCPQDQGILATRIKDPQMLVVINNKGHYQQDKALNDLIIVHI